MSPSSPGVHVLKKGIVRDPSLLQDPKILSALTPASQLGITKESLYVESLYDNDISPLEYGSSLLVSGDVASTYEVGMHIVATALEKQHWCCVVDPNSHASSMALYEASAHSPRFVCVRAFSHTRFATVLSHLVSTMRVVVAHVPTQLGAQHMARVMSRVRENNSILVLLDPAGLVSTSCDRRITAGTLSFSGLNKGSGVLVSREMAIEEYKHGMKVPPLSHQRYA
jgi:hypothetical protein